MGNQKEKEAQRMEKEQWSERRRQARALAPKVVVEVDAGAYRVRRRGEARGIP